VSTTTDPVRRRMAAANPAPVGVEPPGGLMSADVLLAVIDDRSGDMTQEVESPERGTTIEKQRQRRTWVAAFAAGFVLVLIAGVSFGLLIRGGDQVDVIEPVPTSAAIPTTTVPAASTSTPAVESTVASTDDEVQVPGGGSANLEPAIEAGAISTTVSATISGPVVDANVVPASGGGAQWVETRLAASDAVIGDWLGWSVAVDGNRVVVGAPLAYEGDSEYAGAAYLFETDGTGGWGETKLIPSDGSDSGQFGMSVAVNGDRVVVGHPFDADAQGSAHIFDRTSDGSWVETKLTAADGVGGDVFGSSVAVDGDRVVVGAGGINDDTGSVYVFEPDGDSGWAGAKLAASDGEPRTFFGFMADGPRGMPIAADRGRIVIGSRSSSGESTVYVYESDGSGGWVETRLAEFGFGVDIEGDRIVISDESAVHVFEPDGNDGWTQTEVMISDRAPGDPVLRMTQSKYSPIATANGRIAFASFPIDTEFVSTNLGSVDPAEQMGPVYIFDPNGDNEWAETILDVSSNNQILGFVFTVAADEDRVVVGATGMIYVYEHVQN